MVGQEKYFWFAKRNTFGLCKEMEVRDERVVSDDIK